MKLPNGYGSVYKMTGNRRKPFAVRIKIGKKENGTFIYKYIGYFEKRSDALTLLAQYNQGLVTVENKVKSDILFKEVYDSWITEYEKYKTVTVKTHESYVCAFNQLSELHDRKFSGLYIEDLQRQIDRYKGMSQSTINKPIALLKKLYKYAMKMEYIDRDLSQYIIRVSAAEKVNFHKAFTHDEIKKLWEVQNKNDDAKRILIYIYTGFRATELLEVSIDNVSIRDKYIIGGKKTKAGRNRKVPIHDDIIPLVKYFYHKENKWLFEEDSKQIGYMHFKDSHLIPLMNELGMSHTMHDTRHTLATLTKECKVDDVCRKLILGHIVTDITDGVYTHISHDLLLLEINKVKI